MVEKKPVAKGKAATKTATTKAKASKTVASKVIAPKSETYNAKNIKVLKGLDGIRERFDMYIGARDGGVLHLTKEVVTNSIDEFLNGFASEINVNMLEDNYISIEDNGRGIPVDIMEDEGGRPAVEVLFMETHAGGKFDKDSFKVSAGKNGIGVKATNALAEHTVVEVFRDGKHYMIEFAKGKLLTPLKVVGKSKKIGTTVTFKPDEKIFKEYAAFDVDTIKGLLEEFSYVNGGLTINYVDHRNGKVEEEITYYHKDGIKDLVRVMNGPTIIRDTIHFLAEDKSKNDEDEEVTNLYELAFDYNTGSNFQIRSFVNGISTPNGGTHETGFKMAVATLINKFIKENNLIPKKFGDLKIEGDDTREGLAVVIHVKHYLPEFRGQTKDELSNKDVQGAVQRIINSQLSEFLDLNPDVAKVIANKAVMAARGRLAAKNARERIVNTANMPAFASLSSISKLSDCNSKDTSINELFIVEGDSAGGSVNDGRDPLYQAVYSLRGKPKNTFGEDINRILGKNGNKELSDLTVVIGAGIEDDFDPDKMAYGRVNIMADADKDGAHIQVLILTFFFLYMRKMIEEGKLYIAMPPLYRVKERGDGYKFLLDDIEYDNYIHSRVIANFSVAGMVGEDLVEMDKKALRKFLKETKSYLEVVTKLSEKYRIDMGIAEVLIEFNGEDNATIAETLSENFQLESFETPDGVLEVEGLYNDVYHNFYMTEQFLTDIANADTIYRSLSNQYISINDGNDWNDERYLASALKVMYDKSTPKERTRLKGLGETNAEDLWETTLDPSRRRMVRVTIDDFENTSSVVEMLMGKRAELRRDFVDENRHLVVEPDV